MQLPVEQEHERDESRDRTDAGAPDEAADVSEAVLRSDQADDDIGAVFHRRYECRAQEVQEDGGQELRVPLKIFHRCK